MFPLAILAGGLATRMRPITEKMPKSLIEVAGEPFIVHQLRLLKSQKIDRIVLCVGYLGEMIQNFIGDGAKYGLNINYSYDGPVLLGTGGALRKSLPLLDDAFYVLYGDAYLDCNYHEVQKAFEESDKPALMTVFKNKNHWDKSNIIFKEDKIVSYDKNNYTSEMHYIDYGLGVLRSSVIEELLENESYDLSNVYKILAIQGKLAGYEVYRRFHEIGSLKGLKDTERYLKKTFK